MKKVGIDLLLVNPPGKQRVYQSLANDLAAFEPPIWATLIADFSRKQGFSVALLDAEAELLTYEETVQKIAEFNPCLAVFVVYGQQPSASTQCMPGASEVCTLLKGKYPELMTLFMGTHPSALPKKTMLDEKTDFVCEGEGPYTIIDLLTALKGKSPNYSAIGGLWYREDGQIKNNLPYKNMATLDDQLPDMAWDLLPMNLYKAHNWHCWDHINDRKPYASIYTSFGCPYKCSFCCINAPFGGNGIRYFSPDWVINQIGILVEKYNIKNIKFADEMFVLNPSHVLGICDKIIERKYDLNIWCYARVDTVRDNFLEKMRKAGFNWFGLGIESGSKHVRDGVEKGRFGEVDIIKVVEKVRSHDIKVGANYIFGLPDDTYASMSETLDLSLELNTEWANFYSAMAYPGSPLHKMARIKGWILPEDEGGPGWIGYSQHAYECLPLPTETLQAGEVLSFRDYAFNKYFTNPSYISMMNKKFGAGVVEHLEFMNSHTLDRKYATGAKVNHDKQISINLNI